MRLIRSQMACGACLFAAAGFAAPAHAELPLTAIIAQGKAVIDLRARYETVDDAGKTVDA